MLVDIHAEIKIVIVVRFCRFLRESSDMYSVLGHPENDLFTPNVMNAKVLCYSSSPSHYESTLLWHSSGLKRTLSSGFDVKYPRSLVYSSRRVR